MVKLDIVSGFLGSGKTTLISRILESLGNEKIVIIENEYGDVQIDGEVLRVAGFAIYELTNGCVCCTLKEDFRLTLHHILSQNVDRVIFEPSGIFILSEIFDLFKDVQIASRCSLNSVITVVDAVNFHHNVQGITGFFANQIEAANSLVLSKTQLVAEEEVHNIVTQLEVMNGTARIVDLAWEELSPQLIRQLLDSQKSPIQLRSFDFPSHEYENLGLDTAKVFDLEGLQLGLEEIREGVYGEVIRAKGIVRGIDGFWEFSYVYGVYNIKAIEKTTLGAVSFIGRDLKVSELEKAFCGTNEKKKQALTLIHL